MNSQIFRISENDIMTFCFLYIKNTKVTGIYFIILSKMIIVSKFYYFEILDAVALYVSKETCLIN